MKKCRLIYLLFFSLCLPTKAAQVVKVGRHHRAIAISQDEKHPFRAHEYVCVEAARAQVVCGTIVKASNQMALVRLDAPTDGVNRGDWVKRSTVKRRRTATVSSHTEVDRPKSDDGYPHHDVTAGFHVGTTFIFPMLQFQWAYDPHWAIGVRPSYFSSSNNGVNLSALAGMATIDYYNDPYFSGIWGELGIGFFSFSANAPASTDGTLAAISESKTTIAVTGTLGYTYRFPSGLNGSLGAGIQYIKDPAISTVNIKATNLQALVTVSAGYAF